MPERNSEIDSHALSDGKPAHSAHHHAAWQVSWSVLGLSCVIVVLCNLSLAYFDRAALDNNWTRYITRCFGELRIYPICEVFCLYSLINYLREHIERWPKVYLLPAAFFAFWMVEAHYFEVSGSVDFFTIEKFFTLLSALAALGYMAIYYLCFVLADHLFSRLSTQSSPIDGGHLQKVGALIERNPFLCTFALLVIAAAPLYYLSFPAIFMGDTRRQVCQALGLTPLYYMHPVAHTLLIRLCLHVGTSLFHSDNMAIFFYTVVQGVALIGAISLSVRTMVRDLEIPGLVALLIPLVFVVHPRCYQYLVQITKDTMFCACLLTFLSCTIHVAYGRTRAFDYLLWALFAIAVVLFRRDGMYVIIPCLMLLALFRGLHIPAASVVAIVLAFLMFWDNVAMPLMKVEPGSSRVLYTLVFQGTARYLNEHPDDVTEAEHDAIDAVLEYKGLAGKYDPELSDKVIRSYRETATKDDMKAYFSATLSMFRRHPESFIRSVLHNNFEYFAPSRKVSEYYNVDYSLACIDQTNEATGCTSFSMSDAHYQMYLAFQMLREGFWRLPALGNLISSFAAIVTSCFLLFFALRRRQWKLLALMMILVMQIAIVFAGPTNGGYFRYTFPIVMVLPVFVLLLMSRVTWGPESKEHLETSTGEDA